MSRHSNAAALTFVALLGCPTKPDESGPLRVAAASDLTGAFGELARSFEAETGTKVVVSFGSTGLLAKQISEGAPFDLFAAANVSYVDEVVQRGRCQASSKTKYAEGRIVLWTMDAEPPKRLEDLTHARFAKIAIANPEHAPYGLAAKQALEHLGIFESVRPKLVFAENVQQALAFTKSGNTEASVVALSTARTASGGRSLPIDPSLHRPIEQALVICAPAVKVSLAQRFIDHQSSPRGRSIMRRFGFVLPSETATASR